MSRAAQAFKLRKDVRQAQQSARDAAAAMRSLGPEGDAAAAQEEERRQQQQQQVAVRNLVPVKMDGNFNLGPMLARKVQTSEYYRSLRELTTTVPQLVDEVRHNVRSLDPWLRTPSGDAGTAFCALYRLCELRPTRKQLTGMLTQQGAPFVRALGFLFVRFACPADGIWDWVRPFLMDTEQFRPLADAERPSEMGVWLEALLAETKFAGLVLPRFPYAVDREMRARLDRLRAERARYARNLPKSHLFGVGAKVEALYEEDGGWYEAEVLGPGQIEGMVLVRYTAYGNEEEVSLGAVRLAGHAEAAEPEATKAARRPSRSRSLSRDRRRGRDRDRDDRERDRHRDDRDRDRYRDDRDRDRYRDDRDRDRYRDDRDRDRDRRRRKESWRSRSRSRSRSRRHRSRRESIDSDDEEVARRLRQRHQSSSR